MNPKVGRKKAMRSTGRIVSLCVFVFILKASSLALASDVDALTAAVEAKDFERVKAIVEAGADVSGKDSRGWFPLLKASSVGDVKIMAYLVEQGADVNATTSRHNTPLILAASRDHFEAVMWLVKKKAYVHQRNRSGQTARSAAVANGSEEIAALLGEAERLTPKTEPKSASGPKTPAPFTVPRLK